MTFVSFYVDEYPKKDKFDGSRVKFPSLKPMYVK